MPCAAIRQYGQAVRRIAGGTVVGADHAKLFASLAQTKRWLTPAQCSRDFPGAPVVKTVSGKGKLVNPGRIAHVIALISQLGKIQRLQRDVETGIGTVGTDGMRIRRLVEVNHGDRQDVRRLLVRPEGIDVAVLPGHQCLCFAPVHNQLRKQFGRSCRIDQCQIGRFLRRLGRIGNEVLQDGQVAADDIKTIPDAAAAQRVSLPGQASDFLNLLITCRLCCNGIYQHRGLASLP
jgi:hypothetical protein